jgi:hypothetical protein
MGNHGTLSDVKRYDNAKSSRSYFHEKISDFNLKFSRILRQIPVIGGRDFNNKSRAVAIFAVFREGHTGQ